MHQPNLRFPTKEMGELAAETIKRIAIFWENYGKVRQNPDANSQTLDNTSQNVDTESPE